MNKKNIIIVTLLVVFSLSYGLYEDATVSSIFDDVPVDARALGMGGAFESLASGAQALHWNPGGTAFYDGIHAAISYSHIEMIDGLNNMFAGLTYTGEIEQINLKLAGGIGIQHFGDEGYYSENKVHLNLCGRYPIKIGIKDYLDLGLGVNASFNGFSLETGNNAVTAASYAPSDRIFSLNAGLRVVYNSPRILRGSANLGFVWKNIFFRGLLYEIEDKEAEEERIPFDIRISLAYDHKYFIASVSTRIFSGLYSISAGAEGKWRMFRLRYGFTFNNTYYNPNSGNIFEDDYDRRFFRHDQSFGFGVLFGQLFELDAFYRAKLQQFGNGTFGASLTAKF